MKRRKKDLFIIGLLLMLVLAGGIASAATAHVKAAGSGTTSLDPPVQLVMEQRGAAGLEEYRDGAAGKLLYPIVGALNTKPVDLGEYTLNLPSNENFVDCIVSADNQSSEEVYVRMLFAVPSALDGDEPKALHVQVYDDTEQSAWEPPVKISEGTLCAGVICNVYSCKYKNTLPAGEKTPPVISGMYLDWKVDNDRDGYTLKGKKIDYDFAQGVKIPVAIQAVQTDGQTDPFGSLGANPWDDTAATDAASVKLSVDRDVL
ncbi:MAG: hypothetical protein IKJ77_09110 [Firmicutes bacterium]|nr:hypothetical protein [Bacillota bacterium]